jgi:bacterial/archaeal transporter family protein
MQTWILYAIASMLFAGATSVIAKKGLDGIPADLGLAVRTALVFVLVSGFTLFTVPRSSLFALHRQNWLWLAASALCTAASWVCYYRAIKAGEVSTVAMIDKGSVLIAILLSAVVLREAINLRFVIGSLMVALGLWVIARR